MLNNSTLIIGLIIAITTGEIQKTLFVITQSILVFNISH